MVRAAHARGFRPRCVAFDGWSSSLDNLKLIGSLGWTWLTRLKSNRLVDLDRQGTTAVSATAIAAAGTEVWLPGFGRVKVFGIVAPNGDTAYWATNDLAMTGLERVRVADGSWAIETTHSEYTSSRRWVSTGWIGYHRRGGVTRAGRVVPATPRGTRRRNRMPDPTRPSVPPRA